MDTKELRKKLEAVADATCAPTGEDKTSGTAQVEVSVHLPTPRQTELVLQALAKSPSPGLVLHGGILARIVRRGDRILLDPHTRESLRGHVSRMVRFIKRGRDKNNVECDPTSTLMEDLLTLPEYPDTIPVVRSIKTAPLLTADGELIATSGLYPEYQTYLDLDPMLEGLTIPGKVSKEGLERARDLVIEPFRDFPVDDDSVANLFTLLFTMALRELIVGVTPLFIVDANTRGSGKGLLVSVASMIAYGRDADFSPANVSSDELRKRLLAVFRQGLPLHVLDNIERVVWSPELSAVLTSGNYSDRVLGVNELPAYHNNVILIGTGNNTRLGGDIPRRTVLIRLHSKHARPEERTGFAYPDLLGHVRINRRKILRAIYIIAATWLRAGRPVPESAPAMGSFQPWADFAAGLLDTVGASGLLDNRAQLRGRDQDEEEYDILLTRARKAFGCGEFTARQLCEKLEEDDLPAALGSGQQLSITKRMGRLLTRIEGRAFGDEDLCVRHLRTADKTKYYHIERAGAIIHD